MSVDNKPREATGSTALKSIPPYQPKAGEEYMSEAQKTHFRAILNAWKRELMEEVDRTLHHMQDDAANFPDPTIVPAKNRNSVWNCVPVTANASCSRR